MENFYRYYRFIIYLLFEGVKYPLGFEAFWDTVSGEGELTDLFQLLFLPSIFTYLTSKSFWLKLCAVINLILGLFLNAERLLIVLVATAIWYIFIYFGIRVFNVISVKLRKQDE